MSEAQSHISALEAVARERNVPLAVLLELTHRCNLSCRHCYVCETGVDELTTTEVFGILDQLAQAGSLYVTFSGGEIMLRDDLFEIIAEARRLNFAVRLFTNGTLIDSAEADRIAALDPLDLGISIYSARPEAHDFITRQPGSFESSVRAIRLLVERGVGVVVKCPVMAMTRADVLEVQTFADELGARPVFDPQITPRLDGDASPLEYRVDEATLAWMLSVDETAEPPDFQYALPCSAGRDFASISPSGDVWPCVQAPISIGDLREHRFEEIWESEEASAYRAIRIAEVRGCAECADARYCSPCLGLNVLETGDVLEPAASSCRLARARKKGRSS